MPHSNQTPSVERASIMGKREGGIKSSNIAGHLHEPKKESTSDKVVRKKKLNVNTY